MDDGSNMGKRLKNQVSYQQIDCRRFRELLDCREKLSGKTDELFNEHLRSCPSCAYEAQLENALRDVIIPTTVPAISPGFEARLMDQLSFQPVRRESMYHWIGWAVPIFTIILLGFVCFRGIWHAAQKPLMLLYAEAAGHFAGRAALSKESFIANLTILQGLDTGLVINIMAALAVVITGIVAVKWAPKHYPVSVS